MDRSFCPGPVATGVFVELWFKDGPIVSTRKSMLPAEPGLWSEDLQAPSKDPSTHVSSQNAQHLACKAGSCGLLALQHLEGSDAESASIFK